MLVLVPGGGLTVGSATGVDLGTGFRTIRGVISGEGQPIAGALFSLWNDDGFVGTPVAAADGSYDISPLTPGHYWAEYQTTYSLADWITQWNGSVDVPGNLVTPDRSTIPPIDITADDAVVDFDLHQGGSIEGYVGSGGQVVVIDGQGRDVAETYPQTFYNSTSDYHVGGLPPGRYKVRLEGGPSVEPWLYPAGTVWYPGVVTQSQAGWVTVSPGETSIADFHARPPAPEDVPVFADVPRAHPYNEAVEAMAALSIVNGFGDDTFGPDLPVRRAQFAKMVDGALGLPIPLGLEAPFSDLGPDLPGSPYPHQFVAVAAENGITLGVSPGSFEPWTNITRAQVITMIVRGASALTTPGRLGPRQTGTGVRSRPRLRRVEPGAVSATRGEAQIL